MFINAKFADNYVTSFVPVCHMQGGYDLVDVFSGDCGVFSCGGGAVT